MDHPSAEIKRPTAAPGTACWGGGTAGGRAGLPPGGGWLGGDPAPGGRGGDAGRAADVSVRRRGRGRGDAGADPGGGLRDAAAAADAEPAQAAGGVLQQGAAAAPARGAAPGGGQPCGAGRQLHVRGAGGRHAPAGAAARPPHLAVAREGAAGHSGAAGAGPGAAGRGRGALLCAQQRRDLRVPLRRPGQLPPAARRGGLAGGDPRGGAGQVRRGGERGRHRPHLPLRGEAARLRVQQDQRRALHLQPRHPAAHPAAPHVHREGDLPGHGAGGAALRHGAAGLLDGHRAAERLSHGHVHVPAGAAGSAPREAALGARCCRECAGGPQRQDRGKLCHRPQRDDRGRRGGGGRGAHQALHSAGGGPHPLPLLAGVLHCGLELLRGAVGAHGERDSAGRGCHCQRRALPQWGQRAAAQVHHRVCTRATHHHVAAPGAPSAPSSAWIKYLYFCLPLSIVCAQPKHPGRLPEPAWLPFPMSQGTT